LFWLGEPMGRRKSDMKRTHLRDAMVRRHETVELLEHWIFAISGLALLFSGFGELPMYKRYMVTEIPFMGWAGDFHIQLKIHYIAAIAFVGILVFHVIYHGLLGHRALLPKKGDISGSVKTILAMFGIGEEPKAEKFLPEQRLAYAYLGAISLILVLTGIIKVVKNLDGVFLPPALITASTLIHTFATMFFLLGVLLHFGALLVKANRPLLRAIFTGWVREDYARERHELWWDSLTEPHRGPGPSPSSLQEESRGNVCEASNTVPETQGAASECLPPLSFPDGGRGSCQPS